MCMCVLVYMYFIHLLIQMKKHSCIHILNKYTTITPNHMWPSCHTEVHALCKIHESMQITNNNDNTNYDNN